MTDAFLAGLVAGYGVAVPVGAIAILIMGLSARTSLAVGAELAAAGEDVALAPGDVEGEGLGGGVEQPATTSTMRTTVAPLARRLISVVPLAVLGAVVSSTVTG